MARNCRGRCPNRCCRHRPRLPARGARGQPFPQLSEEAQRHDRHALRREDDPFLYETVRVGSYADIVVAALVNGQIQAVVIEEVSRSHRGLDSRRSRSSCDRSWTSRHRSWMPTATRSRWLTSSTASVQSSISTSLPTERWRNSLARTMPGTSGGFSYGLEVMRGLHLSICLRSNSAHAVLQQSQGVRISAPWAPFMRCPWRGEVGVRVTWIRDMGHFYGTNLFLAESSATSGGLDSLLEPTGGIQKAQEQAARCFRADRTLFCYEWHLDREQDRGAGCLPT